MPLPLTDAINFVHGTSFSANDSLNNNNGVWGDPLCSNGTSNNQYSNLELDFASSGFLSTVERSYAVPAELLGAGGPTFGLHLVLGQGYNNNCGNLTVTAVSSNTSNTTATGNNNVASRTIPYAQLITGAHFFIPINGFAVQEYNRFLASTANATNNSTAGTVMAWYGPPCGGEQ